jgi:hypothetical protein
MRRRSQAGRLILVSLVLAGIAGVRSTPQQSAPSRPPGTVLMPEANHLPDVNDRMKLDQQRDKKKNFDAANALRAQQINDDVTKLLILARDLNAQLDNVSDKAVRKRLMREAEVIELLARDVQNRMTLMVGGS